MASNHRANAVQILDIRARSAPASGDSIRDQIISGLSQPVGCKSLPTLLLYDERGLRKTREGLVVSDKMSKTIVVSLEDRVKHPRYSKVIRRTKKVKAHDEHNTAGPGDRVLLMETRPLSATKRWRLVEILEKAK